KEREGRRAPREGGEEQVEGNEEEEKRKGIVVLKGLEQPASTVDVHAGEGEKHGPHGLAGASEEPASRAVGDQDSSRLIGARDDVLHGKEPLTKQDTEGGDREIAPVVANERQVGDEGILGGENVPQRQGHEGPMDEEIVIGPLHLPEESF